MAIIIHPRRFTVQPPLGAEINFGHPLARGLVFYLLYNQQSGAPIALLPLNLKSTLVGSLPAASWKAGQDGSSSPNYNSAYSYWFERGAYCEPNWVSVVSRARRSGTLAASAQLLCKTFNNNGSAPFISYAVSHNTGGSSDSFQAFYSDQTFTLRQGATVTLGAGALLQPYTVAMSLGPATTGGDLKTYFNGIRKDLTNFTGTSGIGYIGNSTGRLIASGASAAGAVSPWNGEIYYSAVYNRPLSAHEMQWLHVEPYAFLIPSRRRRLFPQTTVITGGGQPNVCVATF